jgi:hypothetical protein
VNLTISSVPAGAPIVYAGFPLVAAPHRATAAVGFLTTVGAAPRFSQNGREFVFDSWSDGGRISHDVTIPAQDLALLARYRDTGPVPFAAASAGLGPGGDKLGPVVRLRSRRPARKLTGTVTDPSGVRDLRVALRATAKRRGCRWWNAGAGRLGRATKCAKPRWMKTTLKPLEQGTWAWSVKLGGRLPRGSYTIRVRAEDALGNVSQTLAGKPRIRR